MPRFFGLACAIITILVWAGSFPAITVALEGFSPLPLAGLRFLIASTILVFLVLIVVARRGKGAIVQKPTPLHVAWFAACGLLGIAVYNWLLNTGQQSVSPAAASFLIACQPVFAAIVATRVFHEPFGKTAWLGTGICLCGAMILSVGQSGGNFLSLGAMFVLVAAVCSGSFFALQRPLAARYGALISATATLFFGTLWLSPWIGAGIQEFGDASSSSRWALVYLGVLPGALAYVTWMAAIRELGAARAANLLFFMAPAAALMAVPVTGMWPSLTTWAGGAIALIGVLIVHRS